MSRLSMRRSSVAALAAVCALPLALHAQQRASCAWKPADDWVKRQTEFFDDSKHTWSDDTLRTQLLAAAGLTSPLKVPVQTGVEIEGRAPRLGPTADAMRETLKKLAAVRGSTWPTKSVVGAAGTHAVYLLTVAGDTGLARTVLHRMMEAGPSESPAADVATFEDHMRLIWGRKQIYGTQFKLGTNGEAVLSPMEDSAHADLRREGAALPPFKLGLCMARQAK